MRGNANYEIMKDDPLGGRLKSNGHNGILEGKERVSHFGDIPIRTWRGPRARRRDGVHSHRTGGDAGSLRHSFEEDLRVRVRVRELRRV